MTPSGDHIFIVYKDSIKQRPQEGRILILHAMIFG